MTQIFLLVSVFSCVPSFSQDFKLSDYLKEGEKDATLAVVTMMQEASKFQDSKILIEKGTYHFYPEKAYEQYCYISNHDNTLRRIAFPVKGFDGLTLNASGAKFIFHGVMMPFLIEDSKRIDISNFSIDWHVPLHSEALVEASNSDAKTIDLRIADNIPYVIKNEELIFVKEGYEHDLGKAILYDPERKAVAYHTQKYTPLRMFDKTEIRHRQALDFHNTIDFKSPSYVYQNQANRLRATELEKGLVRIAGLRKEVPPAGLILATKGNNGKNRIANAFHINRSKEVTLHDLTIHHAGGMGVIGERSEDITLDHVNIFPNPESGLMVSTTADASHFVNCKGEITIKNCNFRNQLDDATNVHGSFVIVEDILAADKIGVRVGHYQQAGFDFAEKGDEIGFINQQKSANVAFKSTVKAVSKVNDRYYIITLTDQVAERLSKEYVVENLDWYPQLTITNNNFSDNRARGILLSTPKKILIKNNYFSNMMSAIFIPVELTWWYESGSVQDLMIEGNTFGDCGYGGGNRPVIYIETDLDKTDYIFGRITIRNNTFDNFQPATLKANGVRFLSFTDNTINNSKNLSPLEPDAYVIEAKHIDSLVVRNIKISKDFKNKIKRDNISKDLVEKKSSKKN